MKGARGRGRPFTVDHWPSGSSLRLSDCDIVVSTTPADWFDHWRLFDIRQPRSRNFLTLCNSPRKRSPTLLPLSFHLKSRTWITSLRYLSSEKFGKKLQGRWVIFASKNRRRLLFLPFFFYEFHKLVIFFLNFFKPKFHYLFFNIVSF